MREKKNKGLLATHAKSSAILASLVLHAVLVLVALSFVAVTVITKEDKNFEYKKVERPKKPLKKLKVPVRVNKQKPKPKLRKRIVVKTVKRNIPEFKMPEITGVKSGLASMGDGEGAGSGIGFTMPEIDFFGAKAKSDKVVFVVHFGPDTIGDTPFSRMTGYTIRKRLEDLVNKLPEYTLFNVACYWLGDTWAMEPNMMLATPENKQKVMDWMAPVNPLKGNYDHCFMKKPPSVGSAERNYPKKVTNLPFFAPKWAYPYRVPKKIEQKYIPGSKNGFVHWTRGVTWAVLKQKPDTIFVLTTNYIDGWGSGGKGNPSALASAYEKMFTDTYGPDKHSWPTVNVVVLAKAGQGSSQASRVLNNQFGTIISSTRGDGSVISDIKKYMSDDERELYIQYQSEYR